MQTRPTDDLKKPHESELFDRPIIVHLPAFDENSGGSIVLHMLVHRLRSLGLNAYGSPWIGKVKLQRRIEKRIVQLGLAMLGKPPKPVPGFLTHPSMDVPLASRPMFRSAIAVYPEVISGNPLKAAGVVRWLLNKPQFFREKVRFDEKELTFFYQQAFVEGIADIDPDNLLRVRWLRHDIYQNLGLAGRTGSCRLIRKGARTGLAEIPPDDQSILLDGMGHTQMAEVFNRTEVLFCHDPYTMYAYYAALCGCIPVVLPQPGLTAESWRATFELKRGVAYGMDELDWARATREELLQDMAVADAAETENVRQFALKLKHHFT